MELKKVELVLLIGAIFLAGCIQELSEEEKKAIELVDESGFGKVAGYWGQLYEGGKKCDFEEFFRLIEKYPSEMTQAEWSKLLMENKEKLMEYFEDAKKCLPSFKKKAEKIEGSKYRVTYSFEDSTVCENEIIAEMLQNTTVFFGWKAQSAIVDLETELIEPPELPAPQGVILASYWNSWNAYYENLEQPWKEMYGEDFETVKDCVMPVALAFELFAEES